MNVNVTTGNYKKKIKISALHLAAFVLLYIVNLLLFLALRGYFFLLAGMILTLLFLCGMAPCGFLRRNDHGYT